VLSRDPELAGGLSEDELEEARRACRARTVKIAKGDWDMGELYRRPDGYGLFLLSGFVVRRVGRAGRFGAELLGPGDLLRPWQTVGTFATRPFEPVWSVAASAEVALLDAAFARRAAPYPTVAVQLVDRATLRSRHLVLALAIVQQPRVDRRLHWLFWHLADRWGRTGSEGVRIELPLTHSLLGELVAARRPSVTTALSGLVAEGKVEREGGSWLLRGGPPADYADLVAG
jgi:CRP/FNR family transcriptional regulator, cyclic AMP receptor protein